MALILTIDSRIKVHIQLSLKELINRMIERGGVIDDETNDTCWLNYNVLEEVVSEINEDSYFIVRNGEGLSERKLIINAPKDFVFFRRKDTSSGF